MPPRDMKKFDNCEGFDIVYERELGHQIGYRADDGSDSKRPILVMLFDPKGQEPFKISMSVECVERLKRAISLFDRWLKDPAIVEAEIAAGGVKA